MLAPPSFRETGTFHRVENHTPRYDVLLAEAQRLRGRVYLEDGAVEPRQLTADGRHVQKADRMSWHLLSVNEEGRVLACARYLSHDSRASFRALAVHHSAIAKCKTWGARFRTAVEEELGAARSRDLPYVELGGWALSEELRCTTEAVRMIVAMYGLAELLGGALGISTATTRHGSSSILRRIGGKSLFGDGAALPPYYDPSYRCQMEVLRFDSAEPSPRYAGWIEECRAHLPYVPVVGRSVREPSRLGASLLLPGRASLLSGALCSARPELAYLAPGGQIVSDQAQ